MSDLYKAIRMFRRVAEDEDDNDGDEGGGGPLPENIDGLAVAFLTENPEPDDDAVHDWAESLGVSPHDLEPVFYGLASKFASIFAAGKAWEKGFMPDDADEGEFEQGIKVEMEHTTDPLIAARIALDHLAEIPDYYTRLAKMEKEAGIKD